MHITVTKYSLAYAEKPWNISTNKPITRSGWVFQLAANYETVIEKLRNAVMKADKSSTKTVAS